MNYGIPYMGSKSKIARDICRIFPPAKNFYDLFGGGFSVTHAIILHRSKSYEKLHFNEIRKGVPELIQDAIAGEYSYDKFKPEWVSREDFFAKKEDDAYVKLCWSFGNDGRSYLFGKDIEPYKKSMHNAVVFNQFDATVKKVLKMDRFAASLSPKQRRLALRAAIKREIKEKRRGEIQQLEQLERLQQLERLEQLQQLQQLEQLERLERLERLRFYNTSYDLVPIEKDSIVYCDIPYKGTGEYDKNKHFNHEKFFNWAASQSEPVYVSEYNIEDRRFKLVWVRGKRSLMSAKKESVIKIEKIYVNQAGYEKFHKRV